MTLTLTGARDRRGKLLTGEFDYCLSLLCQMMITNVWYAFILGAESGVVRQNGTSQDALSTFAAPAQTLIVRLRPSAAGFGGLNFTVGDQPKG
jgi:hypothetical protein